MEDIICRLTKLPNDDIVATNLKVDKNEVKGVIAENTMGRTLSDILREDQKYGVLVPKDGKSYGYFIKNKDVELTSKQMRKAIWRGLFRWYLEYKNFDFHRAQSELEADIVIEVRDEADDPILTPQTIAYMYYPLGGLMNGRCVINSRPFFTLHGEGIDMHHIDPVNYPEENSGVYGTTTDLDQVLGHEFGHGVLGLPHVSGIMAPNYGLMTEHLSDLDIIRGEAKGFERRSSLSRKYQRLKAWFLGTSDR